MISNQKSENRFLLEINYKTYFRILFKLKNDKFPDDLYDKSNSTNRVAMISGIFSSEYYKILNPALIFEKCLNSLTETSTQYSNCVTTALKNLTTFCKYFQDFDLPSFEIWKLICVNLESPFSGTRERGILLLTEVVRKDLKFSKKLFTEIYIYWPWTNKHKYFILSTIFSAWSFNEFVPESERLMFFQGCSISLKHKNLLSPGQTLIRVLAKNQIFGLNDFILSILRTGTDFEFENCVKQWINSIQDREDVFRVIIVHWNEFEPERLIYLRNTMKSCFEKLEKLDEIDEKLKNNISSIKNMEEIFDFLLNASMNTKSLKSNLEALKCFLKSNSNSERTSLRQLILKKISIFFDFLAKAHSSGLTGTVEKKSIIDFMIFLKTDLYENGIIDAKNYQSIIFSLKIYQILLKTFSDLNPHQKRLNKNSNLTANRKFHEFLLKNDIWNFQSENHFNEMTKLLNNDFDDIREIACEILIKFFQHEMSSEKIQKTIKYSTESTDIKTCSYGHHYTKVYVSNTTTANDLIEFHENLEKKLIENFTEFQKDPNLSIKSNGHLFGYLNSISEIYRKENLSDDFIRLTWDLISLVEKISDYLLDILNSAGHCKESPNFEVMYKSLEISIRKSNYNSMNLHDDINYLLVSVWMTLKACGELASNIGIYIGSKDLEAIERCLNINVGILTKCRHKGAIEAAGISLGEYIFF